MENGEDGGERVGLLTTLWLFHAVLAVAIVVLVINGYGNQFIGFT